MRLSALNFEPVSTASSFWSILMDGFLIIDKPKGPSSQQVISRVRKVLAVEKAGHTGTLDPLATGVLPVALGEATKVIAYLDESLKVYQVEGQLGVSTDTYDADGKVDQCTDSSFVTKEILAEKLNAFLGEQEQLPPLYSAIKFQGKPLYAYARRGKEVPRQPRTVFFHQLNLETFCPPFFSLRVTCSRGTYIRSLVHDLGKMLGCFANVQSLRRLQTGPFELAQAVSLDFLFNDTPRAKEKILSIEDCLSALPQVDLYSESERSRVESGASIERIEEIIQREDFFNKTVTLRYENRIIALVKAGLAGRICYQRVLNRH
jgi:tRNA pseudouridine55 synthase